MVTESIPPGVKGVKTKHGNFLIKDIIFEKFWINSI